MSLPVYRSRSGFALAAQYVERTGNAECHQLDFVERQGMADEYTRKHSAKIAELVIRKAQRDA